MLDITKLFCSVDDFWKSFYLKINKTLIGKPSRGPASNLSMPEIMTIMIMFHQSNFRTFKYFYLYLIHNHIKEFPRLPSYSRFVHIEKSAFVPLFAYLHHNKSDISMVQSLTKSIWGKLFGDRGYISLALFQELLERNIQLIKIFKGSEI